MLRRSCGRAERAEVGYLPFGPFLRVMRRDDWREGESVVGMGEQFSYFCIVILSPCLMKRTRPRVTSPRPLWWITAAIADMRR